LPANFPLPDALSRLASRIDTTSGRITTATTKLNPNPKIKIPALGLWPNAGTATQDRII
jgi:hypothetical protein